MNLGNIFRQYFQDFQMKCQARMVENQDTHTFGLDILCYHHDKKLSEIENYYHWVGGSAIAKSIKQGDIAVRLVSECFEADTNAGEDPSLEQLEKDFKGLEFEKQFACKFKNRPVDKGVFGKVFVERILPDGHREDIFKFNLIKSGNENRISTGFNPWTLHAFKELADIRNISTDDNWKMLARKLGFTRHEIDQKLNTSVDPFCQILSLFMQRGGTQGEILQAMRDVKTKTTPIECTPTREPEQGKSRWRSLFSFGSSSTNSTSQSKVATSPDEYDIRPLARKRTFSSSEEDENTTKRNCSSHIETRLGRETANLSPSPSTISPTTRPFESQIPIPERTPEFSRTVEFFGGNGPYTVVHRDSTPSPPPRPSKNSVCYSPIPLSPECFEDVSNMSPTQTCMQPSIQLSPPPLGRNRARRDLVLSDDNEELSEKSLFDIAGLLMHNWRTLGHALSVEETELCSIEHSHRGNVREQAFQMLHMWKVQSPEECTKGRLYRSLCEVGLNHIAFKFSGAKRRPLADLSINN